jgi:four helix bundle protein
MYKYSFERLEVWQLARKLIVRIYSETLKFPEEEKFILVNQIRRAALSVASNLAEGSSRNSPKDKANFYQISFSSLMEVLCQIIVAGDLGFINEQQLLDIRIEIDEIANKINALRKHQLNRNR